MVTARDTGLSNYFIIKAALPKDSQADRCPTQFQAPSGTVWDFSISDDPTSVIIEYTDKCRLHYY